MQPTLSPHRSCLKFIAAKAHQSGLESPAFNYTRLPSMLLMPGFDGTGDVHEILPAVRFAVDGARDHEPLWE